MPTVIWFFFCIKSSSANSAAWWLLRTCIFLDTKLPSMFVCVNCWISVISELISCGLHLPHCSISYLLCSIDAGLVEWVNIWLLISVKEKQTIVLQSRGQFVCTIFFLELTWKYFFLPLCNTWIHSVESAPQAWKHTKLPLSASHVLYLFNSSFGRVAEKTVKVAGYISSIVAVASNIWNQQLMIGSIFWQIKSQATRL